MVSICRAWYSVDWNRENQNARRTAVSNDGQRTYDQYRRSLCTAKPNSVRPTGVRRNQIASDQLATLISIVHRALVGLEKPIPETRAERTPAVSIRRSFHRDYVVCLECGWRGQMLRRHLNTGHGLSVDQYRVRWNLSREHPLTAPSYSEHRSGLAKQLGLGRGRRLSREEPEPVAPETPQEPQPRSRRRRST
jgi:predicted transcriptional regulator